MRILFGRRYRRHSSLHLDLFFTVLSGLGIHPKDSDEFYSKYGLFNRENPDYDIKILFAVLDDKILAAGEELLKEIVVEEKQNGRIQP